MRSFQRPLKDSFLALLGFVLLAQISPAGIRGPGEYNGVVIFDRWDACYLYSGVYLMPISEAVKESLRAFRRQSVLVDAQEVFQPINPGDGLITKLKVLGPAVEPSAPKFSGTPDLDGLSLIVSPGFSFHDPDELVVRLRNDSNRRREVDTDAWGPTLLAKKEGEVLFDPADGPSYAAITRYNLAALYQGPAMGSFLRIGEGRTIKVWLAPGTAIARRVDLDPGRAVELVLRFELPPGEYQFLAGYGGGVHAARALASNQLSFDVDQAGKAHLGKGVAEVMHPRTRRRIVSLCGRVTLESGNPAGTARVVLWPYPYQKQEPRAVTSVLADADGWFRLEQVPEGRYVLSATASDIDGAKAGAFGARRPAEAAPLTIAGEEAGCSYSLTVYRQPRFTLGGYLTSPGDSPAEARIVRMIMSRGDALPYAASAAVEPDGRFEFHNVPPGQYQFSAGASGWGTEITGDSNEMKRETRWPPAGSNAPAARIVWINGHYELETK